MPAQDELRERFVFCMKTTESKGNWTRFWRALRVNLGREETWKEEDIYKKDSKRLRRLTVESDDLIKVKDALKKYKSGDIQFHRFTYFFAKDVETVRRWTKASNVSKAFLKLSNILTSSTRKIAKKKLSELLILIELFRKREIIQYEAKIQETINLSDLSIRGLLQLLKVGERNAGFKIEKEFIFDSFTVYCLSKKTGANEKIYKFILIRKKRSKVLINLALDTSDERNKVLAYISKKFSVPINRVKEKPNLNPFITFLKKGSSGSFILAGIEFVDNGFRINISPQYGKQLNVTENQIYKTILPTSNIDILESIQRIRVVNLSSLGDMQVNINFINYKNEDIIGGMRLSLNAKGLTLSRRELLKEDFKNNFGFQLDIPLSFDVDEKEIYKKFLFNPPKKKKRIEIVSDKSIEVSHKLLKYGLLPQPKSTEETARICTFHSCGLKFKPQWTTSKICSCGNGLWDKGSTIVTQVIEENKVRDFLNRISEENNYGSEALFRGLIRRKIYPIEISNENETICLIPITTPLKEQQLEVLKYRYPNLILVTSRDDADILRSKDFLVQELHTLVFDLFNDAKAILNDLLNKVTTEKSTKLKDLAKISSERIMNEDWYKEQKNMGPEFFEADVSMILNYLFKNSIWLGARRRGASVPDSLSAFPIEDKNRGCFLSDSKFSQRINADFGGIDKNKKYVHDGRSNKSVKQNGGLKGFVFISNKPAPNNFFSKMARVVGRKHIKVGFLKNSHLLSFYEHIKYWENEIEMDGRKKAIFLDSMELIFLTPKSLKVSDKIVAWTDDEIKSILDNNVSEYRKLGSPALVV